MTNIYDTKQYTIEHYDFRNISRRISEAFGRIEVDAFKNDTIQRAFVPHDSQFGADRLPPLAEYEALTKRVDLFGKHARKASRWIDGLVGSNARNQLWMLKEKDTGKYMAASLWTLPDYIELPKIPLWQRLWYWFKLQWYKVQDYWEFFPHGNATDSSGFFGELEWGSKQIGSKKTPERVAELESKPAKELAETVYPKDLTYYLFIMVVRSDAHGKGYGRTLLEYTRKEISRGAVPPPKINGPPKLTLIASPTAGGFYAKLGFRIGASAPHELPDGEKITHKFFFKNVD